jgi:fructokinase
MSIWGGVEAGGTKFVCIVGTEPDDVQAEMRFATRQPAETLAQTVEFFQSYTQNDKLKAIGIGSFGPIDPNPDSPTFGYITSTPKPGWAQTDFVGTLQKALAVPIGFDSDVNAAALGEHLWGAAQGLDTFVYLTIGTGIGGGAMVNGARMHGLIHPEMGHIYVPHDLQADPFPGLCPFHGDCLEGLASGPALEKRWGKPGEDLPEDHPAWELEAHYLALGLANILCVFSPQRFILGGGVMEQSHLLPLILKNVQQLLNNYVQHPAVLEQIDDYIVLPQLGQKAGVLGALALAQVADSTRAK